MTRLPTPLDRDLAEWVSLVVDSHSGDVLRFLRRRTNNSEDAADLLGKVLLILWEKAFKIPTTESDARMWLFGIARNVVRDYYRHGAKRLDLSDKLRAKLNATSQDNAADVVAEETLELQRLRDAVRALDARSREIIILVHWDGFNLVEAARILRLNESTARTRYARAKQRLAVVLMTPTPLGTRQSAALST